ncbi:hypothetical protein Ahy_B01g056225 isoform B [Arachis hypogaea]|uniref:Uncharacterized protein n=1 Tax=Arachis hypogaea TaxID=3818 RepID=A0A445AY96_ARAHY|nr:hypothetical protein Ahy_B01g056225 isoform B [Arachis hypogaea]
MRAMMSDYNLCCRPQARTNVNNLGERCTAEISASARSPPHVVKVGNWKGESNIAYPVPRMGKIIEKVLISVAFSELKAHGVNV